MPFDVDGRLDDGMGGRDLSIAGTPKLNWLKSSGRFGRRPFRDAEEELRSRLVLSSSSYCGSFGRDFFFRSRDGLRDEGWTPFEEVGRLRGTSGGIAEVVLMVVVVVDSTGCILNGRCLGCIELFDVGAP